jgi:predicted transcriptional regulator of viral defense system
MQYERFRRQLKEFTVFSISDVRNLVGLFSRRRLNEWQDKGYLVKIIKGYYIFSDLALNENILFEIANRIYPPSYVSFEMALSHYGCIPESVYGVTSASPRKTCVFRTKIAAFSYRTISPRLFFGYNLTQYDGKTFKIASPAKALLDYLYINSDLKTADDYAAMRIDKEIFFRTINKEILLDYLERFAQKALTRRVNGLLEFLSKQRPKP